MDSIIIENKVAKSGLLTLDLETFFPKQEILPFDISPFLFHGFVLKEKDYRESLIQFDWSPFKDKIMAVFCSTDAILAPWSFMLVVQQVSGIAKNVRKGTVEEVTKQLFLENLLAQDWSFYSGKRVLIKGCSNKAISDEYYSLATSKLIEAGAERVMYGEACSFVPVFRK